MTERGPIFVVGLGRSGTSMLMNAIDRTEMARLVPESHFLDTWVPVVGTAPLTGTSATAWLADVGRHPHVTKLDLPGEWLLTPGIDEISVRAVFDALMRAHAGDRVPGDKTPVHHRYLDLLTAWYPDARVVFLIRDPRAYVASMQALDVSWASTSVSQHARKWHEVAASASKWASHPQVEVVRYEALVRGQADLIDRLGAHLGLDLAASWTGGEVDRLAHGSLRPGSTGLSASRIDAWRDSLDWQSVAVLESRLAKEMAELGYEPTGARLSVNRRVRERMADVPLVVRSLRRRLAVVRERRRFRGV